MRIQILGALLCTAVLFTSCLDNSPTAPPLLTGPPDIEKSPRPDADAELAALVLSGALVAPDSLYERIHHDLELIRDQLGDSIPQVKIAYGPPWPSGSITMQFEPTFLNDTASNRFHQFDSLNKLLRLDTERSSVYSSYHTMLFNGRLHPARLIEMYQRVPGIVSLGGGAFVGDSPEFFIIPDGNVFRYFFRDAWGDCPAGCIFSDYYYVTVTNNDIDFIGSYLRDFRDTTGVPDWLDSVKVARYMKNDRKGLFWRADNVDTLSAYFPNAVGNQWVYNLYDSLSHTFDTLTVTITGNTTLADSMEAAIWVYDYAVRQFVDTQYVSVRDSLVLVYRRKAGDIGPLQPDLEYVIPFRIGQTWMRDLLTMYSVENTDQLIPDFRNTSYRIRRTTVSSGTDFLWFHPHIGLTRNRSNTTLYNGTPSALEIISYRLFPDI